MASWIGGLFQRESLPTLEASMAMATQRQILISNNIANVNTPHYQRQTLPEGEFEAVFQRAVDERERRHWNRFSPEGGFGLSWDGNHVRADVQEGRDFGPLRHDENNVVVEKEMGDLMKNTMYMSSLQRLFKSHTSLMLSALRDRVT